MIDPEIVEKAIQDGIYENEMTLKGKVMYDTFVNAVNNGLINQVKIDSNGYTVFYQTKTLGIRGATDAVDIYYNDSFLSLM